MAAPRVVGQLISSAQVKRGFLFRKVDRPGTPLSSVLGYLVIGSPSAGTVAGLPLRNSVYLSAVTESPSEVPTSYVLSPRAHA